MDPTSSVVKTNRITTCTRVVAPIANATVRFDEGINAQGSRSLDRWKKRVGIASRRRWPSTSLLVASEVHNPCLILVLAVTSLDFLFVLMINTREQRELRNLTPSISSVHR